jgi:hypothetical protein
METLTAQPVLPAQPWSHQQEIFRLNYAVRCLMVCTALCNAQYLVHHFTTTLVLSSVRVRTCFFTITAGSLIINNAVT